MRVLITGSRTWTDAKPIRDALERLVAESEPPFIVIHGGAGRGADYIASQWVADEIAFCNWPINVERYPADWQRDGKRAGILRNVRMVEAGADLCLAFIRDASKGATHCATAAEKAGIETRVMTWDERPLAPPAVPIGGEDPRTNP
jgi:hypothetical protein